MLTKEQIKQMAIRGEDITQLDVSHITDMSSLFKGLKNFNQDISSWDTSNVISMDYMFYGCESFNQNISKWNTSNLLHAHSMFYNCESFNQDLSSWDVRKLETLAFMFFGCKSFTKKMTWDIRSAIRLNSMFENTSFTFDDIKYWVVNLGCSVSRIFDSQEKVFKSFFTSRIYLKKIYSYRNEFFEIMDTYKIHFYYLIKRIEAKKIDEVISKYNITNVKHIQDLHTLCECYGKLQDPKDIEEMIRQQKDITQLDVRYVKNMGGLFQRFSSFNQDISRWDVSNVTDMRGMFTYCNEFNQDISSWNTSNVTNMKGMFDGCEAFNQDLSKWDVSKVTDMSMMFDGCISFKQDLSSWDVSNVRRMHRMFDITPSFVLKWRPNLVHPYTLMNSSTNNEILDGMLWLWSSTELKIDEEIPITNQKQRDTFFKHICNDSTYKSYKIISKDFTLLLNEIDPNDFKDDMKLVYVYTKLLKTYEQFI